MLVRTVIKNHYWLSVMRDVAYDLGDEEVDRDTVMIPHHLKCILEYDPKYIN